MSKTSWQSPRLATIAVLAIGCGRPEPSQTADAPRISIPPASASASEHQEGSPPSGRTLFGSVARLTESELSFDEAELLTGAAADDAARAEGKLAPGEHVDNDTFVRDDTHTLVTLPIAENARVLLLKRSGPPDYTSETVTSPSSLSALLNYFAGTDPDSKMIQSARYRLTLEAGKITKVEEIYFP